MTTVTGTPTVSTPVNSTPSTPNSLTLWLPPVFDPSQPSRAGQLLTARLQNFERLYGVQVNVRIKEVDGAGGLLDALTAASAAAPLVLPSVIALPRSDLETAAQKGLVQPLDGLSTAIDEADWYTYARELAMVQGKPYALPFAGDTLVMVFRSGKLSEPPTSWDAILRLAQPVAFPAGDSQAMLQFALYQSLGGKLVDPQRHPSVQVDALTRLLQLFVQGEQRGVFPYWLSQYETYAQTWQAYRELKVNALPVWATMYLADMPTESEVLPLPSLGTSAGANAGAGSNSAAITTGWGWSVTDPRPERRALAARLAEYLSAAEFQSQWTEIAGWLPTRPSAMASWSNHTLQSLFSPVLASAHARPAAELLQGSGPALRDATLKVLKRDQDAAQAAQAAADRLNGSQLK